MFLKAQIQTLRLTKQWLRPYQTLNPPSSLPISKGTLNVYIFLWTEWTRQEISQFVGVGQVLCDGHVATFQWYSNLSTI